MRIDFTVHGIPQPQGSTRAFVNRYTGRAAITSDNKKLKPWRQEVAAIAQEKMRSGGFRCSCSAVSVICRFYFQKPKWAKKSVVHKTTKPDIDKLLRGVLDALTGITFDDDSQVVQCHCHKGFREDPGCEITVMEMVSLTAEDLHRGEQPTAAQPGLF